MTRQGLKIATVVLILVAEFVLTRISLTYRRQPWNMNRQADWTLTRKLLMSIKPVAGKPDPATRQHILLRAVPNLVAAAEAVD